MGDPATDDIFDSSLSLEDDHLKEGYNEGFEDGKILGKQEGKDVGLKLGFETGEELGFYWGCINVWNAATRINPDVFSSRVCKNMKQMEELLDKYPILEPEDEHIDEIMASLRLKFRIIASSLSVHIEYNGYPKSSEGNTIGF
ncbi:hypothetical protein AMTRI_Chr11g157020 [Amborella trichopoda]